MKRLHAVALLAIGLLLGSPVPAMAQKTSIDVAVAPTELSVVLGDRFTIETRLTNTDNAATGPLLAHLNVASLDNSVYVDPEDWSSERSQDVELEPGEAVTLSWELQAVNPGQIAVYVVVLPYGADAAANQQLVVSRLARVDVARRSTLTAGGVLPVVLIVPAVLAFAAIAARLRLRWRR